MSQEQYRVKAALAAAHDAQRGGSDYGMGGNFNGIQISSRASGTSEIDKLREELQALKQAAIQKGCPTPAEPETHIYG